MKFKPFSRKQLKVLSWWKVDGIKDKYDAIIADGSVRSGKTVSMSISFIFWAMAMFSDCNFAICGKTVGSCRRNVIKLSSICSNTAMTSRINGRKTC